MNVIALPTPKARAQIRDWQVTYAIGGRPRLHGFVFEHVNGSGWSFTTELLRIDFERSTAETRNTIYTLGQRASITA